MVTMIVSTFASAADNWGYVDNGFYYRDLAIVPGDPVPLNTGGIDGDVEYVDTWLLSGTIENAEGRSRSEVQVRVTGTDCSGEKAYWSVVVPVGPLGPNESFPFLRFIANTEPQRPCLYKVQVYER